MDAAQAIGAVALLAVEVCVKVIEVFATLSAMTVGVAHGIFYRSSAIVDGMDEVMGQEQRNAAVDGGLVDCVEPVLQTQQRECLVTREHLAQYQNAYSSGTDVALLKHVDDLLLAVHD